MAVCMECGRKLRSQQSKEVGYGPVCYKRVFGTSMRIRDGDSKTGTASDDFPYYEIIRYEFEIKKKEGDSMDSQSTEERAEKVIIALTPEQLKDICANAAEIGAKEALKTYEQERKKEQGKRADRRLRNTKLLLRNYHMLKEHAENSVFGRTQMEESALDILESMMNLYDNEVIIESIKRSATRTAIIVSHIETMFGLYDAYCEKSPNQDIDRRRYDVVWDKYMAEPVLTVKEIAAKHNIPVVCKLPIDPAIAAKCDRGAAEEYEGEWLDPMVDFLEKMR